jgi:hypothetical protein
MTLLEPEERKTLLHRLQEAGAAQLARIYLLATGEDSNFIMMDSVIAVSVRVLGLVGGDSQKLCIVCSELVATFPSHATNAVLNAILHKLQAQIAGQTADPTEELWIGSEPMVNRATLRFLLKYLVNGHHFGVVYIAGGAMSGRSHSYQLIRHVARSRNVPCHMIDFEVPIESRTLPYLYSRLNEAYGVNAIDEPTHEGATAGDVAGKFALLLRSRLVALAPANPKPWVVIDYTDEVPDPAVPEFLRMICAARDANKFDNCVIFVLGPTAHLETMRTQLFNLEVEEMEDIDENDILECAVSVNQKGIESLTSDEVIARVRDIYASAQAMTENARLAEVRRGLLMLRREVRAP